MRSLPTTPSLRRSHFGRDFEAELAARVETVATLGCGDTALFIQSFSKRRSLAKSQRRGSRPDLTDRRGPALSTYIAPARDSCARVSQKKRLSQKCLVSGGDNHYVVVAQFRTPVAVCWSVGIRTRGAERRLSVQSKSASRVKSPRRRLAVVSERRQSYLDGCFRIPPVLVLGSRI
jgi:hypothetical protein